MQSISNIIKALKQFDDDVPVIVRQGEKFYEITTIEIADFGMNDLAVPLGQMPIIVIEDVSGVTDVSASDEDIPF